MKLVYLSTLVVFATLQLSAADSTNPLRVGIIGLVHGHASGFLNGSALTPAGGAMHRSDVKVVGIVEPDDQIYEKYAKRNGWSSSMRFQTVDALVSSAHPQAALIFTSTAGHTEAVKQCAARGVHVMMEKPLAISYREALQMAEAARKGHVHVLTDYETSWYPSNKAAYDLVKQGKLGSLTKTVVRDGHSGPAKIHVSSEFFSWLTDPKENGAGALYDFGCYGADLMTWLTGGEMPVSVFAVTKHLQPTVYTKVDDEADVVVNYKNAVAILQGSWTWPFNVKDMDVYGTTGYARTLGPSQINVRLEREKEEHMAKPGALTAPYDDPLHYLRAVIHGDIEEGNDFSSLKVNLIVSQILDAARRSAQSGEAVNLAEMK